VDTIFLAQYQNLSAQILLQQPGCAGSPFRLTCGSRANAAVRNQTQIRLSWRNNVLQELCAAGELCGKVLRFPYLSGHQSKRRCKLRFFFKTTEQLPFGAHLFRHLGLAVGFFAAILDGLVCPAK